MRSETNAAVTGSANSKLSRDAFDPTGVGRTNAATTSTIPSAAPMRSGRHRAGTTARTTASAMTDRTQSTKLNGWRPPSPNTSDATAAAPAAGRRSSAASCRRPANSATAPGIPSSNAATGLAPPHSAPNTAASKAALDLGSRVVVTSDTAIKPHVKPTAKVIRPSRTFATWVTAAASPPITGCTGRTRPSSRVVNQVLTTAATAPVSLVPTCAMRIEAHSV